MLSTISNLVKLGVFFMLLLMVGCGDVESPTTSVESETSGGTDDSLTSAEAREPDRPDHPHPSKYSPSSEPSATEEPEASLPTEAGPETAAVPARAGYSTSSESMEEPLP